MTTIATVVWTEIPVADLAKGRAFYEAVFGWSMVLRTDGPNDIVDFISQAEGVSGHLYVGTPANGNGPTIHLAVQSTLEDGMARVTAAGGKVVSPAIDIPPGRFAYGLDPDGNSIGLFEPRKAA